MMDYALEPKNSVRVLVLCLNQVQQACSIIRLSFLSHRPNI